MGKKWKLTLPVPLDNGVDYLVLEDDSEETGGFYLYYMSIANPDIGFDDWFEYCDNAQDVATEFGLSASDWQPIEPDKSNG